jgi:mRNA interferase MazF
VWRFFCPISSQIKGYPFEVLLSEGLSVKGAVLSDQVKSLDWKIRQAEFICRLPAAAVDEVLRKLNAILWL